MTINIGDTLANGAVVLDYAPSLDPNMGKVIAMAHSLSPADPYVIWSYSTADDGTIHCVGGRYFDDITRALHYWVENHKPEPCRDCGLVREHHYDCQTNWV